MSISPIKLNNDPLEALQHIAAYLRTVRFDRERIALDGEGRIGGHWQTDEWLAGLLEIADECDRICAEVEA